jgi:opacity protein-like surface antigen
MSPRRQRFLASLAFCASLVLAGSAAANGVSQDPTEFGWSELQAGFDMRAKAPTLRASTDATRVQPISTRAAAPGFAGLKLWASGSGYAVGRRSVGYGVQGGASLELNEGIDLTASYRLNGFARGDRLDAQLADVSSRSAAPYLGLDIEF